MKSKTERRKALSHLTSMFAATATGVFIAVLLAASPAFAQKTADSPLLFIYRGNAGIVSSNDDKNLILRNGDANLEPVAGDFDADGIPEIGTFDRSSGLWTVRRSGDGSTLAVSFPPSKKQKISSRPVAVPADYDGDGATEMAVWCAGAWQIPTSAGSGQILTQTFGISGDVPVPADYDGDEKADLAVFRPAENRWYIRVSETGVVRTVDFGSSGTDILLPADYSGDGKADIAVYRSGVWLMIDSETGAEEKFEFGFEDARPVPGDFNRDGEVDFAVYRKGTWYVYEGSRLVSYKFGGENDVPLSVVSVRQSTAGF